MSIVHNLLSLNIQTQLQRTSRRQNNSYEKISSGMQINKASDNAAGLSISEKMRAQIRGLSQAVRNIEDGISFVQVADQGLGQINDPALQRMRELIIQAGNGALTDDDRQMIQNELEQLKSNIDDIAHNTHFNEIYMLHTEDISDYASPSISPTNTAIDYSSVLSVPPVSANGQFIFHTNLGYPTTAADNNQTLVFGSGGTSHPQVNIDGVPTQLASLSITPTTESAGVYTTKFSTTNNIVITQDVQIAQDKYEIKYTVQNNDTAPHDVGIQFHLDTMLGSDDAAPFLVNNTPIPTETEFIGTAIPNDFTVYNQTVLSGGNPQIQAEGIIRGSGILVEPDRFGIGRYSNVANWNWIPSGSVGDSGYSIWWNPRTLAAGDTFAVNTFYGLSIPPTLDLTSTDLPKTNPCDVGNQLLIQIGANSDQNLTLPTVNADAKHLGVRDIVVIPFSKVDNAIKGIDTAIAKVSYWRSNYGALQNALADSYDNVQNTDFNAESANAHIRDTDIAKETAIQIKEAVKLQAAQAISSKAAQMPQMILQLLQEN